MLLLKCFKFYSCHNFKGCSLCNFTRCKITKQLQPPKGVLQLMLTEERLKMVGFVIIRPKSDRFGCHPTEIRPFWMSSNRLLLLSAKLFLGI